ncbi:MAG: sugar phosphate isomerase/epimerase [Rhizobiales bacterium]|nr:sugar phosphate isomerase/epimerase [Hyphomicrobiales bacterium]OJU34359.1 MAG: xylose isomerase [Rhizobiales bacterium 68-8]
MTAFSYQLYSSRNFPPLDATLKMVGDLGYAEVEGFGGVYGDPKALKAALDRNGLKMTSGHFGIDMLENEVDKALDIARTVGMKAIYCPYLMPDQRPTDAAGWRAFGKRLEKAGKPYRDAGYIFGWHNHDFEFKALPDGSLPMTLILEAAPSLTWEADVAWIVRGGADPIDWIRRYGDRLTAVHVKDIAPAGQNADEDGWADVGHGTVPWKAIWAEVKKTPAKIFVMEHDKPNDDARFARRSLEAALKL